MKTCKRCGAEKSLADFYPHPMMADGHLSFCKTCIRAQQAAHRATQDQDERRAYNAAYYQQHREEIKAQVGAYQRTHREQVNAGVRRRRAALTDEERRQLNRKKNQRHRLHLRAAKHKRRAAAGIGWRPAHVRLLWVLQDGACFWCGAALVQDADPPCYRYHVDHIIPLARRGRNDPANLVLSCAPCNWSRNHRLPLHSKAITA